MNDLESRSAEPESIQVNSIQSVSFYQIIRVLSSQSVNENLSSPVGRVV